VLTLLVLLSTGTGLVFIGWLLLPQHIPGTGEGPWSAWTVNVARLAFVLMVGVELIRLVQNITIWIFAFFAKDPVPMDPPIGLRVALLTTIVPSREPIEVVARTLRRMKDIVYCGQVDVWILDEGDDPDVKKMAAELGVRHFTRNGIPEYNQESGQFRAGMKSGNHNSWRVQHENDYDVVVNLDPDHVPLPNFLERTLGYFRDPDVAFVVAPQVYGNMYENWVVHGASAQQYVFNGIIERAGNGLGAPMLIGTNHLYRPEAWRQIGGYQESIIEDHLTSMRVQATDNPATGNRWKGVYTPDVVAIGEGPASWADYFSQQTRWATGIWEILLSRQKGMPHELRRRQRFFYGLLQFYYPSVGLGLFLSNVATATYMVLGQGAMANAPADTWLKLWALSLGSWFLLWFFLRRYNIAEHEREEVGMLGMALSLFAGPVYLSAAVSAILRRPLTFKVTPKGKMRSAESIGTFRVHLLWAAVGAAMLGTSFWLHHDHLALRIWSGLTLFTGLAPPVISVGTALRAKLRRGQPEPWHVPELDEAGRELGPEDGTTAVRAETPVPAEAPVPAAVPAVPVPVQAPATAPAPAVASVVDEPTVLLPVVSAPAPVAIPAPRRPVQELENVPEPGPDPVPATSWFSVARPAAPSGSTTS
jgi:cellulose synthase/poly-beta-1,6-N-acetylglucosamine synthase-like glycosyltransferase